jgi:hypothetical protein
MGLLGGGVLATWNDIAPGDEAEFNTWYTREHVPERVGVPGFLRGRRYVAASGTPQYLALYETKNLDTLASAEYLHRLNNPAPSTRRVLPLFRNFIRATCRVTLSLGQGVGGVLATVRLGPVPGREDELRAWLTGTILPALVEGPEIVGAHLCEADPSVSRIPTDEQKLRGRQDVTVRWIVLAEGTGVEAVDTGCRRMTGADELGRHGAAPDAAFGIYRLLYSLERR